MFVISFPKGYYTNPDVPCGTRYSDQVLNEIGDDFLFENENANHKLVKSRALDDPLDSNQTARTALLIERQTESLAKMMARLNDVSGTLGGSNRDRFKSLVQDSKALLPTNSRLIVRELGTATKRLDIRSPREKRELEAEARDLFGKSRGLLHRIHKNMQIKTRVSVCN